jgi:hypothetical protein
MEAEADTPPRSAGQALRALVALFFFVPAIAAAAETAGEPRSIAPAGFMEATDTELFPSLRAQIEPGGIALALYLPHAVNQLYRQGREDAVTRQVLLYRAEGDQHLDRRGVELMARTLAGAYAGYEKPPPETLRDREARARFYRLRTDSDANILVEEGQTDNAFFFVTLLSYPAGPDRRLLTALCTTLVPVADKAVFVAASSIVTDDAPLEHLTWVKNTGDAFAAMLVSANRR